MSCTVSGIGQITTMPTFLSSMQIKLVLFKLQNINTEIMKIHYITALCSLSCLLCPAFLLTHSFSLCPAQVLVWSGIEINCWDYIAVSTKVDERILMSFSTEWFVLCTLYTGACGLKMGGKTLSKSKIICACTLMECTCPVFQCVLI